MEVPVPITASSINISRAVKRRLLFNLSMSPVYASSSCLRFIEGSLISSAAASALEAVSGAALKSF